MPHSTDRLEASNSPGISGAIAQALPKAAILGRIASVLDAMDTGGRKTSHSRFLDRLEGMGAWGYVTIAAPDARGETEEDESSLLSVAAQNPDD